MAVGIGVYLQILWDKLGTFLKDTFPEYCRFNQFVTLGLQRGLRGESFSDCVFRASDHYTKLILAFPYLPMFRKFITSQMPWFMNEVMGGLLGLGLNKLKEESLHDQAAGI